MSLQIVGHILSLLKFKRIVIKAPFSSKFGVIVWLFFVDACEIFHSFIFHYCLRLFNLIHK
jgi:hypothetical protein